MNDSADLEARIEAARQNPKNLGEMAGADAVGTMGSPDCGDYLRMWVKFREKDGKKVIDRATFQTFGCQTAIAVASVATDLIVGKTPDEAMAMTGEDLSAPLGPLPPMKIHCAQLVESALRSALSGDSPAASPPAAPTESIHPPGTHLYDQLTAASNEHAGGKKVKITLLNKDHS